MKGCNGCMSIKFVPLNFQCGFQNFKQDAKPMYECTGKFHKPSLGSCVEESEWQRIARLLIGFKMTFNMNF